MVSIDPRALGALNPISAALPVAASFLGGGGGEKNSGPTSLEGVKKALASGQDMRGSGYWAASAYNTFKNIMGREPSEAELQAAIPSFSGNGGDQRGAAYIAQMKLAEENSPANIQKRQQAEYAAKAPQYYDSVGKMIKDSLGRDATPDELSHFGSLMASGSTDAYGIQQFLQQQPEYTSKQNKTFQDQMSNQLAGYDKQYFQEKIMPAIQETYAKQGRSFDSSAFQNAATQSAQQQNTTRQQYLAQLSAQQYGGVQERAYQDYANQVANQQAQSNFNLQSQYNRKNEVQDYSTQQNAYNQYLAKYGKRNNGLGSLIGGVAGGVAGAYLGGPMGASVGYQMGSSLGQAGQNYAQGGSY